MSSPEYNRAYYAANREVMLAKQRERYVAYKDDILAQQREYSLAHKPQTRAYVNAWRVRAKKRVMDAYGGNCQCCGEAEIGFLTIDHIDGYKKGSGEPRAGHELYRYLIRLNFPPGFQTLCMNCNTAKGRLGACPHQQKKQEQK